MTQPSTQETFCPCGLERSFAQCCLRRHTGEEPAHTPEELMRARYSAFVVGNTEYLLTTWSEQTRPTQLELDSTLSWRRLRILATSMTGPDTGTVEFRAHFRTRDGQRDNQHELSRFRKEPGGWRYVDGLVN